MSKIRNYITSIFRCYYYDNEGNQIYNLKFIGDGQGDFEKIAKSTTKECLEAYIENCHTQIALAKEALDKCDD